MPLLKGIQWKPVKVYAKGRQIRRRATVMVYVRSSQRYTISTAVQFALSVLVPAMFLSSRLSLAIKFRIAKSRVSH